MQTGNVAQEKDRFTQIELFVSKTSNVVTEMPRGNSTRKGRSERKKRDEEDVDKQLKALGMFDANIPFQERRDFLTAIKESKKDLSAEGAEPVVIEEENEISATPSPIDNHVSFGDSSALSVPEQIGHGIGSNAEKEDSQSPKAIETYASKLQTGQIQKDSITVKELHVVLEKIDQPPHEKTKDVSPAKREALEGKFENVIIKTIETKKSVPEKNREASPTSHSPEELTEPANIPKKVPELTKEELRGIQARARDLATLLEQVHLPHMPMPYPLKVEENIAEDVLQMLMTREQGLRDAQLLTTEQIKWKDPVSMNTFAKKLSCQTTRAAETSSFFGRTESPPTCSVYDFPALVAKGEQDLRMDSSPVRSRRPTDLVANDMNDFQVMETSNQFEGPSGNGGQCPICRETFPVNVLEEHASQCNDFLGEGEAPGMRSFRQTRSKQQPAQPSNRNSSVRFPTLNETTSGGAESDGPKAKERGAVFTSIIEADDGEYRTEDDIEQCDNSEDSDFGTSSKKRGKKQSETATGTKGKKRRC